MNEPTLDLDLSFQDKFLALIINNKDFRIRMMESFQTKWLEDRTTRFICDSIFELQRKISNFSAEALLVFLRRKRTGGNRSTIAEEALTRMADVTAVELEDDIEFIENDVTEFIRKSHHIEAVRKTLIDIRDGNYDNIVSHFKDIDKIYVCDQIKSQYVLRDRYERFDYYAELVYGKDRISTGWDCLDQLMFGGLQKGNMGIIVAPTGGGKSLVLANLALNALKNKKNTLFYSLEMNIRDSMPRFDSYITGTTYINMAANPFHVMGLLEAFKEENRIENEDILVRYLPKDYCTTNMLKSDLEKLRAEGDFVPDLIVVDYPDLISPPVIYDEYRHTVANTYREMRAIAEAFDLPVWVASQTNREAEDVGVITKKHLSESYEKSQIADHIITVCAPEEFLEAGTMFLFATKMRGGKTNRLMKFDIDFETMTLSGGVYVDNEILAKKKKSKHRDD